MNNGPGPRAMGGNAAGKFLSFLFSAALVGLGLWLVLRDNGSQPTPVSEAIKSVGQAVSGGGDAPQAIEALTTVPALAPPQTYVAKDNIVEVDISEYAGYGGLIVANGGMAPNPDSIFAKEYGFQLKLSLSEGENWSELNAGRFAASATTADVLAVLGRQLQAVVPVQIGFSRGADMVVVDHGLNSINNLKGKVLAASQFNESEFFIRYLAQEAGLPVKVMQNIDSRPAAGELGLLFYEDAFSACDAYAAELTGGGRLNGCVGWAPRTNEVVDGSQGKAKILVSNRNLLVVADILCVNRGFAQAQPKWVQGLVHGLLDGNRKLRDEPERYLSLVTGAFKWSDAQAREEMARVHLANLPENLAFFNGTIDAAGSFGSIYQSSVLSYGSLLKDPVDSDRFLDLQYLKALDKSGKFAGQKIAIAPLQSGNRQAIEGDALLSKDIRFLFEPNSAALDMKAKENADYLDIIKRFLQVSPGSMVLLRGHVDNAKVEDFRKAGGEKLVQNMALKAMELSKQRAQAVRDGLVARYPQIDAKRIETVGRGWEEPAGEASELNRRVEVQWFALE